MNKTNCSIIEDILPLYVDDICQKESRKIIEAHLSECTPCAEKYKLLTTTISVPIDTNNKPLIKFKHLIRIKLLLTAFLAMVILSIFYFIGINAFFKPTIMDYNKYNFKETISVIEENNSLFLVRTNGATKAFTVFLDPFGKAGDKYLPYTDENGIKHITYTVTLYSFSINKLHVKDYSEDNTDNFNPTPNSISAERNLLGTLSDSDKIIDAVYYYNPNSGDTYLIWENPDVIK